MRKILALANLHGAPILDTLNERRGIASTSFLGRYTFIDFTLSNFSNSGIDMMGILVENKLRSLVKHIGTGSVYNANTKNGFCSIMYNEQYANNPSYNNDINNLIENHWVLDQSSADYVILAPAHLLYRINFNDVIDYHIKKKASVTMVYKTIDNGDKEFMNLDELKIDDNGRVLQIQRNKGAKKDINISLETYIISRSKLDEFLDFAKVTSHFFSIRDVLSYLASQLFIHSYEYKGYLRCFLSSKDYIKNSLELLNRDVLLELFDENWPIYTRTNDTPPARYGKHASVSNCFIANGARIEGKVKNSIIGRDVVIERGAKVENSIILTNAYIGKEAVLKYCIIDKTARVVHVNELTGLKDSPLIVKEGDII